MGAILLALMCWAGLASGQQLHLDEAPSTEPTADAIQRLPMDDAERESLREALKAHDYGRA